MRLLGQVLEEQGIHRPLEPDVQVRDVALGERDDVHASECQTLEQAGGVLLVAAEAIEGFSEHDIERVVERGAHQRLEAGAEQCGTGHGVVRVLLRDGPALALRKCPAHAHLICDRRVALIIRRVSRVDGDLH
ncbi:MAG TPA: hypothetical protein VFV78_02520 [Vicinamibacterales bacterium]|nr:hypothetical protein [Vicinamibacterales bacterium]